MLTQTLMQYIILTRKVVQRNFNSKIRNDISKFGAIKCEVQLRARYTQQNLSFYYIILHKLSILHFIAPFFELELYSKIRETIIEQRIFKIV